MAFKYQSNHNHINYYYFSNKLTAGQLPANELNSNSYLNKMSLVQTISVNNYDETFVSLKLFSKLNVSFALRSVLF